MLDKMWKRGTQYVLSAVLFVWATVVGPAGAWAENRADHSLSRISEIYELLGAWHVSGVSKEELADAAIRGMIESLGDPYTQYYTEKEWAEFENSLQPVYAGIGTRLGQNENGFVIVEVFADSPAAVAGLKAGDRILSVSGNAADGMSLDQLADSIRGPEGTEVQLTVERNGNSLSFTVKRQKIEVPVVSSSVLTGGIGYIKLSSFADEADERFAEQLAKLEQKQIRALVIDLRDNPGGIVDTARNIAAQFIAEGTLMHARDRNGKDVPVPIRGGRTVEYPVVLIVNGGSASASEVLAGALQDYGKATIVGEKTFGKGSVQTVYALPSGGMLKMTTEHYLTPHKHKVDQLGITPDIVAEGSTVQMVTALRTAGAGELRVAVSDQSVVVNGATFYDNVPVVRQEGRVFAPVRLLAVMAGVPVEWIESERAVVTGDGERIKFSEGNGFLIYGSTGLADVQLFCERYPQLNWSATENELSLEWKGTGN